MTRLDLSEVPRVGEISQDEFQRSYMKPLRPAILKDLAASWPALKRWTPEYLSESFGARPVKVYDASFAAPGEHYMSNVKTISLGEYLKLVATRNMDLRMFLYRLNTHIPELLEDIEFPRLAEGFSRKFVFMFFGCQGSFTPMHFDIDMAHVFHTAIRGRKRVTLFPYEESGNLYRHPFSCRSYVDVDHPDFNEFPRLENARGFQTVMEPGETLFIPGGFWHYIQYSEPGYSVSLRCPQTSPAARLKGYANLGLLMPFDRLMNKLFSDRWFRWKEKHARN